MLDHSAVVLARRTDLIGLAGAWISFAKLSSKLFPFGPRSPTQARMFVDFLPPVFNVEPHQDRHNSR